jgi:hypothetical protein
MESSESSDPEEVVIDRSDNEVEDADDVGRTWWGSTIVLDGVVTRRCVPYIDVEE